MPNLNKLWLCSYLYNLENNCFGNEGAKHLTKAQWPNL